MLVHRNSATGQWTGSGARQTGAEGAPTLMADVADEETGHGPNSSDRQSQTDSITALLESKGWTGKGTSDPVGHYASRNPPDVGSDEGRDILSLDGAELGTAPSGSDSVNSCASSGDLAAWSHIVRRSCSAMSVLMGRSPLIEAENGVAAYQNVDCAPEAIENLAAVSIVGTTKIEGDGYTPVRNHPKLSDLGTDCLQTGLRGYRTQSEALSSNLMEEIIERALRSTADYMAMKELQIRDAIRSAERAERARVEAEVARVRSERRLDELTVKMDKVLGICEAQTERISALEREKQCNDTRYASSYLEQDVRDIDPYRMESALPITGEMHCLAASQPVQASIGTGQVFLSASTLMSRGHMDTNTATPPSESPPALSSLGHTIIPTSKQPKEAVDTLRSQMQESGHSDHVKPDVKAVEPTKYSGCQDSDLNVFTQFVEHSVEHLIDGQLLPDRYASKIRLFPEEWIAKQVIQQLLNSCFKDGFTCEQVWEGLNDDVSPRLYWDQKHPRTSTYGEVLGSALVAEQAINNNIHCDQSARDTHRRLGAQVREQRGSSSGNAPGTWSNAISFVDSPDVDDDTNSRDGGVEVLDELSGSAIPYQLGDSEVYAKRTLDVYIVIDGILEHKQSRVTDYVNYLDVNGMNQCTLDAIEMSSQPEMKCPRDVLEHRRECFSDDAQRFGDPLAEHISFQLELNTQQLPHLWAYWLHEYSIQSDMTELRNRGICWAIYDPALYLPILLPLDCVICSGIDLGGWYRKRIDEFMRLVLEYMQRHLGMDAEDCLETWMANSLSVRGTDEPGEEEYDFDRYTADIHWPWNEYPMGDDEQDDPSEGGIEHNLINDGSRWIQRISAASATLDCPSDVDDALDDKAGSCYLSAAKIKQLHDGGFASFEGNTAQVKSAGCKIREPVVTAVCTNGRKCKVLPDSGPLGDFTSSTLAEQWKTYRKAVDAQLAMQLEALGSKTMVNNSAWAQLPYAYTSRCCNFDIMSGDGYDLILGSPFIWKCKILARLNPARIIVWSDTPEAIESGEDVGTLALASGAMELENYLPGGMRRELRAHAAPLYQKSTEIALPPLRRDNHCLPVIGLLKNYSFRASQSPEGFHEQWNRSRSDNTERMARLLPDQSGTRCRAAGSNCFMATDLKGACEQVRIKPEHAQLPYGLINCRREFGIMSLDGYNVIPGASFLWECKILMELDLPRVTVVCDVTELIQQGKDVGALTSQSFTSESKLLGNLERELCGYEVPLYQKAIEITLPLLEMWTRKRDMFLKSSCWPYASCVNSSSIRFLRKSIREVRYTERNGNTEKLCLPPPDLNDIRRCVARSNYLTELDLEGAFELVRAKSNSVRHTLMETPEGLMVNFVLQPGNPYAIATLMVRLTDVYALYIRMLQDMYLDELLVHNDEPDGNVCCIKLVIGTLKENGLYLLEKEMHSLPNEIKLLRHIAAQEGLRLDLAQVDKLSTWELATSWDSLREFLGAIGHVADSCTEICTAMKVINRLTGDKIICKWSTTEQRAFVELRAILNAHLGIHRVATKYGPEVSLEHVVTDRCLTDGGKMASVSAFHAEKPLKAQQNYLVHVIEPFAGFEVMVRYHGAPPSVVLYWHLDHKGSIHSTHQRNLIGRQVCWLEKQGEFNLNIVRALRLENELADLLLRMCFADDAGKVHAVGEMAQHDNRSAMSPGYLTVHTSLSACMTMLRPQWGHGIGLMSMKSGQELPLKMIPVVRNEGTLMAQLVEDPLAVGHRMLAESGRPGTVQEFANGNKKVTLLPVQRQEGGMVPITGNYTVFKQLKDAEAQETEQLTEGQATLFSINALAAQHTKYVYPECLYEDKVIHFQKSGMTLSCISDGKLGSRSACEITLDCAHLIHAHPGSPETILYLQGNTRWKSMISNVYTYCERRSTCKCHRSRGQRSYDLLNPLPVSTSPWMAGRTDFVAPLPEVKDQDSAYSKIRAIVDLLAGRAQLISSRQNYRAKSMAKLVFTEVDHLHDLPNWIVSDRNVLCSSTFWKRSNQSMGTELKVSSDYRSGSNKSIRRVDWAIIDPQVCVGGVRLDHVDLGIYAGGRVRKPLKIRALKNRPTSKYEALCTRTRTRTHRRFTHSMPNPYPEDPERPAVVTFKVAKYTFAAALSDQGRYHLTVVIGEITFDLRTSEFRISRFTLHDARCTSTLIQFHAMARFLEYDQGIRDNSIMFNKSTPTGYEESCNHWAYILLDGDKGLFTIIHDISHENGMRGDVPGPELKAPLFMQEVCNAMRSSAKDCKRRDAKGRAAIKTIGDEERGAAGGKRDNAPVASDGSKRKTSDRCDGRDLKSWFSSSDSNMIAYSLLAMVYAKLKHEGRWKENKVKGREGHARLRRGGYFLYCRSGFRFEEGVCSVAGRPAAGPRSDNPLLR
jgi:hypothetical protein